MFFTVIITAKLAKFYVKESRTVEDIEIRYHVELFIKLIKQNSDTRTYKLVLRTDRYLIPNYSSSHQIIVISNRIKNIDFNYKGYCIMHSAYWSIFHIYKEIVKGILKNIKFDLHTYFYMKIILNGSDQFV